MQSSTEDAAGEQEHGPLRQRSSLLLAIVLVAAAAALVLAVLPQPQARACGAVADCAVSGVGRREFVAAVMHGADPSAPPVAEVFRAIRPADTDGGSAPIPPSETRPAQ